MGAKRLGFKPVEVMLASLLVAVAIVPLPLLIALLWSARGGHGRFWIGVILWVGGLVGAVLLARSVTSNGDAGT